MLVTSHVTVSILSYLDQFHTVSSRHSPPTLVADLVLTLRGFVTRKSELVLEYKQASSQQEGKI